MATPTIDSSFDKTVFASSFCCKSFPSASKVVLLQRLSTQPSFKHRERLDRLVKRHLQSEGANVSSGPESIKMKGGPCGQLYGS